MIMKTKNENEYEHDHEPICGNENGNGSLN